MTAPETLRLAPNRWVPNSSLPVLIYRGVVPVGDPGSIEAILRANRWRADWRDGVYPYHHYHSTAHEALACTDGTAELILGGAGGTVATISAGDLLVLPAGTGHCRVQASEDFLLVGAYPEGQEWDVCREAADAEALQRITAVPLPEADPIGGEEGDLMTLWRRSR